MFSSVLTKGKGVALQAFGSEAQRIVATDLYDDAVQVISAFNMNRVASLTFGDEVCGEIFDMLEHTISKPMEFTVLTLQKALVLTRHLLVYGSEKCVNSAWAMGGRIDDLRNYNTVLMSQQNPNSPMAIFQRLKGGSVDRGGPVREAATELISLLSSSDKIRFLRNQCADPNSLVPVGRKTDAAFVSDEVRLKLLQRKMREELGQVKKSNLAKAEGGFGAGYNPSDPSGKKVVGAAHSLDEMIKMAKREKSRYTDEVKPEDKERDAAVDAALEYAKQQMEEKRREEPPPDLLGLDTSTPSYPQHEPFRQSDVFSDMNHGLYADDIGSAAPSAPHSAPCPATFDLLGAGEASGDLLGISSSAEKTAGDGGTSNDLLDMMSSLSMPSTSAAAPVSPFDSVDSTHPSQVAADFGGGSSGGSGDVKTSTSAREVKAESDSGSGAPMKKAIMGSMESTRAAALAALDDLLPVPDAKAAAEPYENGTAMGAMHGIGSSDALSLDQQGGVDETLAASVMGGVAAPHVMGGIASPLSAPDGDNIPASALMGGAAAPAPFAPPPPPPVEPPPPPPTAESDTNAQLTKFCLNCGTKLPAAARFCSSCGGKQT